MKKQSLTSVVAPNVFTLIVALVLFAIMYACGLPHEYWVAIPIIFIVVVCMTISDMLLHALQWKIEAHKKSLDLQVGILLGVLTHSENEEVLLELAQINIGFGKISRASTDSLLSCYSLNKKMDKFQLFIEESTRKISLM